MSTSAASETLLDSVDLAIHRVMALASALEDRLVEERRQGAIEHWEAGGAFSTLVGAAVALSEGDWLFAGPRDLAGALARGAGLDVVLSHVFATAQDPAKGRVLPMRLSLTGTSTIGAPPGGAVLGTGFHNGAHLTHAAGVAWGAKIRHDRVVALAFFDEDEISGAEFHNALNFAGVFKVPAVFVAVRRTPQDSLGVAIGAPAPQDSPGVAIGAPAPQDSLGVAIGAPAPEPAAIGARASGRGVAYGIPSLACDGDDVTAVYRAVREAVDRARAGEGATLVDASTVVPEPKTAAEAEGGGARPALGAGGAGGALERLERALSNRGLDAQITMAREAARKLVDDAVVRAKACAPGVLARGAMFDDVYGAMPWNLTEQRESAGYARRNPA